MLTLVIRKPDRPAVAAKLSNGTYLAGSDSGCQIPLAAADGGEGRHAKLMVKNDRLYVCAIAGTTYLNGKKIPPGEYYEVTTQDHLRLGMTSLQPGALRAASPAPAAPAAAEG
ncbi:MAG: FHA domain-containing protein, partial [Victivallaceae bacterium]|nr:FHA domain-containing protein [Victivallaceae bacterium]